MKKYLLVALVFGLSFGVSYAGISKNGGILATQVAQVLVGADNVPVFKFDDTNGVTCYIMKDSYSQSMSCVKIK